MPRYGSYIGWVLVPAMLVTLTGCNSSPPKVLLGAGQGLPGQNQAAGGGSNSAQGTGNDGSTGNASTGNDASNGTANSTSNASGGGNGTSGTGTGGSNTAGGSPAVHPTTPGKIVPFDSPDKMGNLTFRVMSTGQQKSLDQAGTQLPPKGDHWQTVKLVVVNNGKAPVAITSAMFQLQASLGSSRHIYGVSLQGQQDLAGVSITGQQVAPGDTVVGQVAFAVPNTVGSNVGLQVVYDNKMDYFDLP